MSINTPSTASARLEMGCSAIAAPVIPSDTDNYGHGLVDYPVYKFALPQSSRDVTDAWISLLHASSVIDFLILPIFRISKCAVLHKAVT